MGSPFHCCSSGEITSRPRGLNTTFTVAGRGVPTPALTVSQNCFYSFLVSTLTVLRTPVG